MVSLGISTDVSFQFLMKRAISELLQEGVFVSPNLVQVGLNTKWCFPIIESKRLRPLGDKIDPSRDRGKPHDR